MNKHYISSTLLIILALVSNSALAHTGLHEVNGFLSGFGHPFSGLDHLLVMLGVGLWASRLSRINASTTIAAFLSFMVIGASLAVLGVAVQGLETGILASVLIVGLLLASARKLPIVLITCLLASFALLHGFAHGLEIPLAVNPTHYAFGFVLATALINSIGLSLGLMLNKYQSGLRIFGIVTSSIGLWLLLTA